VEPGPRHRWSAAAATDAKPKKILVVEDDVDVCALIRFALEVRGLEVESASDGLSALQRVRQARPDLVILDLNMPRMGGEDFLYAWRTGVEVSGVPVIVISAASQALRPQDLGVEAYFSKPFDMDELLDCVGELLDLRPARLASRGDAPRRMEMIGVVDDLASAISTVVITVEQLADAHDIPERLRLVASTGLDAVQRAAVLARRLNRLINAPI
jgi:DNA-binding response OmpR family regulator